MTEKEPAVSPSAPPPPSVLTAFGLTGRPERLAGGEGNSFRCGEAVLKPVDDPTDLAWTAPLLVELPARGFRLARPIRTRDGGWSAEGWAAAQHVSGSTGPAGHWRSLLSAAAALHAALRNVPRPQTVNRRTNRWAVADRCAWGEEQADPLPEIAPLLQLLTSRLRPLRLPSQLVHADLAGNVLFAPDEPPAIIDFTPYWRPADYSAAVVVVDGLLWWGAGAELLKLAWTGPVFGQLVLRASIFRLLDLNGKAGEVGQAALAELPSHVAAAQLVLNMQDSSPA